MNVFGWICASILVLALAYCGVQACVETPLPLVSTEQSYFWVGAVNDEGIPIERFRLGELEFFSGDRYGPSNGMVRFDTGRSRPMYGTKLKAKITVRSSIFWRKPLALVDSWEYLETPRSYSST